MLDRRKRADGDGENLTYKLFVGTTRDNLVEQLDIKENVEQGTEVSWQVAVADSTSVYYYKIIVSDKYADVDSGIRETNNAPVLGAVTIEKDLDETTGNWVKAKTNATDQENDKITYTFKMWKKEEGKSEEELVQQEPTRTATKKDVNAGEVEITITGLEEYTDYVYRIDVADKDNNVIGTKANVKTYCSGTGFECTNGVQCDVCEGDGICSSVSFSCQATNPLTNVECPICNKTVNGIVFGGVCSCFACGSQAFTRIS